MGKILRAHQRNLWLLPLLLLLGSTVSHAAVRGALDGVNPMVTPMLNDAAQAEATGDWRKAAAVYNQCIRLEGCEQGVTRLARVLLKQNLTQEAKRVLETYILERNPFHVEARLVLSEVLQKTGDTTTALKEVLRVEKLRPTESQIAERKGLIFYQDNNFEGAITQLGDFLKQKPLAYEARLRRGQSYLQTGRTDSAIGDLRFLSEKNPLSSEVHEVLGDAFYQASKFEDSEKAWRMVLSLSPDSIRILEKLGDLHARTNRLAGSEEFYVRALEINPGRLDIGTKLGKVYLQQGKRNKAEDEFRRQLSIDPSYDPAQFQLVKIYVDEQRFDTVGALLRQWTDRFPEKSWLAVAYAKILVSINRYDMAENAITRSLKLGTATADAPMYLAYIRSQAGEVDSAMSMLRDVEKDFPADHRVKYNLAVLMQKKGDFENAKVKYSELPQDSTLAAKARGNLQLIWKGNNATADRSPASADGDSESSLEMELP